MRKEGYMSIEEMIKKTEEQHALLEKLRHLDSMSDREMYEQREDILSSIAGLYGYKAIVEGVDITQTEANPISPIRDRIFDATASIIPTELKVKGFDLLAADNQHIKKGIITIMGSNEEYLSIDNTGYSKGVEIGRISVYTNEFKLNKMDLTPKDYGAGSINELIARELSEEIESFEIILNKDNSFNDVIRLLKEKGEKPNKKDLKIARKNFKKMRENNEELVEGLSHKKALLEHYKDEDIRSKKQDQALLNLKTIISENYSSIREGLLELGYKENNDEYFGY